MRTTITYNKPLYTIASANSLMLKCPIMPTIITYLCLTVRTSTKIKTGFREWRTLWLVVKPTADWLEFKFYWKFSLKNPGTRQRSHWRRIRPLHKQQVLKNVNKRKIIRNSWLSGHNAGWLTLQQEISINCN